jgi:hypothetical protein
VRLSAVVTVVGLLACSREATPIEPERDGALTAADVVTSSALDGKKVRVVALVGSARPPRALVVGHPILPLVDGAVSAERARPPSGFARFVVTGRVEGRGSGARLAVDAVTPWPGAAREVGLAQLAASPRAFDEARVSLEGELVRGEERSSIGDVWVSGCRVLEREGRARVRAEGWLFTNPHGEDGFGHTNAYRAYLQAERCERVP